MIRHPSYLGFLVGSLRSARLSFRAPPLLMALLLPPLFAGISAEERLLRSHLGDESKGYRSHTSRLLPGIYCGLVRRPSRGPRPQ